MISVVYFLFKLKMFLKFIGDVIARIRIRKLKQIIKTTDYLCTLISITKYTIYIILKRNNDILYYNIKFIYTSKYNSIKPWWCREFVAVTVSQQWIVMAGEMKETWSGFPRTTYTAFTRVFNLNYCPRTDVRTDWPLRGGRVKATAAAAKVPNFVFAY